MSLSLPSATPSLPPSFPPRPPPSLSLVLPLSPSLFTDFENICAETLKYLYLLFSEVHLSFPPLIIFFEEKNEMRIFFNFNFYPPTPGLASQQYFALCKASEVNISQIFFKKI
jgi:hypothetical protein